MHYLKSHTKSLIKGMVESGVDIKARDNLEDTRFIYTYNRNQIDVVKDLLTAGADINARSRLGGTGLTEVVAFNSHEILQFLLSSALVDHKTASRYEWNVFLNAAVCGDIETLSIFESHWPVGIDGEKRMEGQNVIQIAQPHLEANEEHSQKWGLTFDDDPVGWYEALDRMVSAIMIRQEQAQHSEDEVWEDTSEDFGDLSLVASAPCAI